MSRTFNFNCIVWWSWWGQLCFFNDACVFEQHCLRTNPNQEPVPRAAPDLARTSAIWQVGLTRLPVSDSCEAVSGASSPLLHTAGMMLLTSRRVGHVCTFSVRSRTVLPAVWSVLKHWPNHCSPQTLGVMLTYELSNTAADQRAFILQLKRRAADSMKCHIQPALRCRGWVNVTFHSVLNQDLQTTGSRSSSAAVLFTGLHWARKPQWLIYCRINAESPPQLFSTREHSSGI